jgi:hypothetical protein
MNYEQRTMNYEPKKQSQTNPIYPGVASGKAGPKPKKCRCQGNPPASRRPAMAAGIKIVTVLLTLFCIGGSLCVLRFKEADLWNYPG